MNIILDMATCQANMETAQSIEINNLNENLKVGADFGNLIDDN